MNQLKTKVVILGAGVAGISLAMYLKRANIDFVLIEKNMVGGKLHHIAKIENYPPYKSITGPELAMSFYEYLINLNIEVINEEIKSIKDEFIVTTENYEITSKYLVLATGLMMKKTNIKNYDKYLNKGIFSCAICDGFLYKNKAIAIIGDNEIASKEFNYLSSLTNKIIKIDNKNEKVISFEGDEYLNKIITNKTEYLVDGAFVYLDESIDELFMKDYNLKTIKGHYATDEYCCTSNKKIYAIGDVRNKEIYQIVSAINDALITSMEIIKKKNE